MKSQSKWLNGDLWSKWYPRKYTNPARGILNFCKQKFCRRFLCSQWTRGPFPPSADLSQTEREREKEKEHGEPTKRPPSGRGLISELSRAFSTSGSVDPFTSFSCHVVNTSPMSNHVKYKCRLWPTLCKVRSQEKMLNRCGVSTYTEILAFST